METWNNYRREGFMNKKTLELVLRGGYGYITARILTIQEQEGYNLLVKQLKLRNSQIHLEQLKNESLQEF